LWADGLPGYCGVMPAHAYDHAAPVPAGYDNPADAHAYDNALIPPGYDNPHVYDNALTPPGYDNPHVYDNALTPPGYDNPHVYDNVGGGSPEAAVAALGHFADEPARPLSNRERIQNRIVKTNNRDAHGKDLSWVTDDHAPLHGRDKGAKYGGEFPEDRMLGFRAPAARPELRAAEHGVNTTTHGVSTKYANAAEREAMRVSQGDDGLLEDAQGSMKTGHQGFVMSPAGAMYTFDGVANVVDPVTGANIRPASANFYDDARAGHKVKTNHHSTPLAGGAVAAAGHVDFDDGSLASISDDSGHYTPEAEYTHQAVRAMANSGMSMQRAGAADGEQGLLSTKVKLGGFDNVRGAGKSWIKDHNDQASPEDKMDEGVISLPYQAFLTSHGNERQMRLKSSLNKQIGGAATTMAATRAERMGISPIEALGNHTPEVPGTRPEPVEAAEAYEPSPYVVDGDDDEPNPDVYEDAPAPARSYRDENLYDVYEQGGAADNAYPQLDD